jgi:hypothetical protein
MEILLLRSNAMLLPPIFYFGYFAMNIKATGSFLSLLASDTCILSKKLIKVLRICTKSKINNHFIMVMGNFSCSICVIYTGTRLLGFSGELVTYRLPHQLMNQISIVLDGYWYNVVVPST